GDLLQAADQLGFINGVHLHGKFVVGSAFEDAVELLGNALQEITGFEEGAQPPAARELVLHAPPQQLTSVPPDRRLGIELGIKRARDALEIEQGLREYREFLRQTDV